MQIPEFVGDYRLTPYFVPDGNGAFTVLSHYVATVQVDVPGGTETRFDWIVPADQLDTFSNNIDRFEGMAGAAYGLGLQLDEWKLKAASGDDWIPDYLYQQWTDPWNYYAAIQSLNGGRLFLPKGRPKPRIANGKSTSTSTTARKPTSSFDSKSGSAQTGRINAQEAIFPTERRPAAAQKPIDSSRPRHGTIEHDATSFNRARKWDSDPATVESRFNQQLIDANGHAVPGLRPDAQRIRMLPDGRLVVDIIEVRSPSQTPRFMDSKIQQYREVLGDQAGDIRWVEATDAVRR